MCERKGDDMDKKLKIAVIGGGTVLVLGAGIWFGAKHFRKTTVPVYSMEELAQEVWGNTPAWKALYPQMYLSRCVLWINRLYPRFM